MSDDIEARLAALSQNLPWRLPQPLGSTGDPELDAAAVLLGTADIDGAAAKSAESKHADVAGALLDLLERAAADYVPFVWASDKDVVPLPDDIRERANVIYNQSYNAWHQRGALLPRFGSLLDARMDDTLRARMSERIERPSCPVAMQHILATSLLGWRWGGNMFGWVMKREELAAPELLARLANHVAPGDPLVPFAAEAIVAIDPNNAVVRVAAMLAATPVDERIAVVSSIGHRLVGQLDLDAEPRWVEVLGSLLRGLPLPRLAFFQRLYVVRTSAPLLAALTHVEDEPGFTELLGSLRRLDDPRAAKPLEAIALSLPETPPKPKLARSRATVLALAKKLARKRKSIERPSFAESAAVGTDGGPVIILPSSAAADWGGAPATYGQEGAPESDYDRACAAVDAGGAGFLDVGGKRAMVLPNQRCGFAELVGGTALLIADGSELMIEMAMAERGAFKKLKTTIAIEAGGLVLLDAAHSAASAPEGAIARVTLAAGTYAIEEARLELAAGAVHALRLKPIPRKRGSLAET